MKKIIVTIGVSGSGKSTWAHEQWEKNPLKTLVVNRDKIRELLFGYSETTISEYYKRKDIHGLEKQVTLYEDTLIHDGLNQNKTVIVDATHLRKEYLERFNFFNVPIEFVTFEIPLKDAIERCSKRNRVVEADVIITQFNQFKNLTIPTPKEPYKFDNPCKLTQCYIVDIDGTIAEKGDRNPFDWKNVGKDTLIENVFNTIWDLGHNNEDADIIFCSGRDESCREETMKWLQDKFKLWGRGIKLYMRPEGDMRPDWIVKEELWNQIVKEGYHIVALIDDRNQVCRRARALGLTVLQVEYGNF